MQQLRILALCLIVLGLGACSARYRPVLDAIATDFRFQYHECVPLGWVPVPAAGSYYPGYTASLGSFHEFLDAAWRGRIDTKDLGSPTVQREYAILNHLVHSGLLSRSDSHDAAIYELTVDAWPYYFDSSIYNNNRDSLQYLCYSQVEPTNIDSVTPIEPPKDVRRKASWYRVTVEWEPSRIARWARDSFLREHSVILPPLRDPAQLTMYERGGVWYVHAIDDNVTALPALSDIAAWKD